MHDPGREERRSRQSLRCVHRHQRRGAVPARARDHQVAGSAREQGPARLERRRRSADLVVLRLLAALVFAPMALWWVRTTVVAVVGGREPVLGLAVVGGAGTTALWLLVWTPLLVTASCGLVLGIGALIRRTHTEPPAAGPRRQPPTRTLAAQEA